MAAPSESPAAPVAPPPVPVVSETGASAGTRPSSNPDAHAGLDRERRRAKRKKKSPVPYPFWFGGSSSSLAACVTHPLDLVKVRLQMRAAGAPKSMSGTFVHIFKANGLFGLYNGLSASLLRQITYSTVRFGVYEELKARVSRRKSAGVLPSLSSPRSQQQQQPSFPTLVALAAASGFLGGVSGNAADVLNVRMQHDAALPVHERRNYRNALHGWVRMTLDEGLRSWFRGWWPNSVRAAAMTASQLASYDTAHHVLVEKLGMHRDGVATHFTASFLAGLVAATVTSPVDVVKTRVMSASGPEGSSHGVLAVVRDVYRTEGIRWMFRGWVPSFLRLGPQTICTFLFLETHRKFYRRINGIRDESDSS